MTVDQRNVIDMLGVDKQRNDTAVLWISDHLDWNDPRNEHLAILQDKLNYYLAIIESGALFEIYPAARGKKVVIQVVGKYALSDIASQFYTRAKKLISDAGFELEFNLLPEEP